MKLESMIIYKAVFFTGLLRYPFDTLLYTIGIDKSIKLKTPNIILKLNIEISSMDQPRNRLAANTSYSFNFHHQITQGYTNKGQYIGTYLANGGNSQSLTLSVYYKKGFSSLFLQRANPDNTYSYINHAGNNTYKSQNIISLLSYFNFNDYFSIYSSMTFEYIINSKYYLENNGKKEESCDILNMSFSIGVKYLL